MACRVGGEEFTVILPTTNIETAKKIAERVRNSVSSSPFSIGAGSGAVNVTVSIGVAALAGPRDTFEEFLKRADQALYAAKRGGRNRVTLAAA